MKILITLDSSKQLINGVVTSVFNLLDGLKGIPELDVRILTLSDTGRSYREENIYFIKAHSADFIYPGAMFSFRYNDPLVKELINWRPDIIHTNQEFFTYSFARKIIRQTGAVHIHTYHTLYEHYVRYVLPESIGQKLVYPIIRKRLKNVQALIAPTQKTKNRLLQNHVKIPTKVVPTGIESQLPNKLTKSQVNKLSKLRQSLDIPTDAIVIGSAGRIAPEKNLTECLEGAAPLLQQNKKLYYLIVGDGPDRQKIEQLTKNLKIDHKVRFTGMVPYSEIDYYYRLMDIFLTASVTETQGLTYQEAMTNGATCIVRRDEAFENIIVHGKNGYIYDTLEELTNYISNLVNNPSRLSSLRHQATKDSAKFCKKAFAQAIYQIYTKSIAKG